MARKLKRDAARVAIRLEAQGDDLALQSIEIPQKKARLVYDLLVNIYESGLNEANTVYDCNIRAATDIAIDKFWIIYDRDAAWAASLNDGVYEADGAIGDLMDDYDLFITKKKTWNEDQDIITVESAILYNMNALVQKFEGKSGVVDIVTYNSDMKPDSDIDIEYRNEHWNISFTKKWSSLRDTKSHSWNFNVSESSMKASFDGETGDQMPDWMRCQLWVRRK